MIAACLALSGRLLLIREFGTSLAYQDQWKMNAIDVLLPWSEGRLKAGMFFEATNDHWNVIARLYSFLLTAANGQWNNLLETTGAAFVCAAAAFVLVLTVVPLLGRVGGLAAALATGTALALPFTWENTLMGVQFDLFLQIVLSLVYLRAVCLSKTCDLAWWCGHVAVGAALFTQRSAVLALAPGLMVCAWRLASRRDDRRIALAGLTHGAALVGVYFLATPEFTDTTAMMADSWRIALDVFLRQLGWPLPHPGWSLLMYLPGVWFVLDRLGRRQFGKHETFVVAVGLWAVAQGAAVAYGRGAVTHGFVSRYSEFLTYGMLANGLCLALLFQTYRGSSARPVVAVVAIAWTSLVTFGLWHESVGGHARHNLDRRLTVNEDNMAAVRDYIATGDARSLAIERIGQTLYSYPPALIDLLNRPHFRALLPSETKAPEARPDHGRLSIPLKVTLQVGPMLALGVGLTGIVVLLRRRTRHAAPPRNLAQSAWTLRGATVACASGAIAVGIACVAWPHADLLDPSARWHAAAIISKELGSSIDLTFDSTVGPKTDNKALQGAVAVNPIYSRNAYFGTLIGGYEYSGIVRSQQFVIESEYLLLPVTGWPCWAGNAVRWLVTNPATGEERWLPLVSDPTLPRHEMLPWMQQVSEYRGWLAQVYLYDGNTDEHGWVGVMRPVSTNDAHLGSRWMANLRAERAEPTHHALLGFLGILTLACVGLSVACRQTASLPLEPVRNPESEPQT